MVRMLRQMLMIKASIMANTVFYYLKRLWGIGKYVPDRVYGSGKGKWVLAVVLILLTQLVSFVGKAGYLIVFVVLPTVLAAGNQKDGFDCMVQILFFLSGVMGPLQDSMVFQVTKEKLTCIQSMRMPAGRYIKGFLLYHYIPFAVYFLVGLVVCSRFFGGSMWEGIALWIVLMMMRMIGEAFQLWLYDKKAIVFSRKTGWVWMVIILSLAGAYSFIGMEEPFLTAERLFHPIVLVGISAAGILGGWYLARYQGYDKNVRRTVSENWLFTSLVKETSHIADEKNVGMQEKDLQSGTGKMKHIRQMHGYAYFHALFFLRHKRQFRKLLLYRLAAIAIALLGGMVLWMTFPEVAYLGGKQIPRFLPVLVFLMYLMTIADKACKAMFYNCDKSMLRFGFYREPKTILSNFRIRLMKIGKYNLMIGGALCAAVVVFRGICGIWEFGGEMILFCSAVLMLSVFFTVHHLFLYYVFQPYSEEMNVKNPFFKGINFFVYMICFACYQIQTGGIAFIGGVLLVTVVYSVVALLLVYRYAPKMFRVK